MGSATSITDIRHAEMIIGVDPDIRRSGYAVLDMRTKRIEVQALPFARLWQEIISLQAIAEHDDFTILVIIEAGWLNQSNWHFKFTDSKAKCAALGHAVGMNHEVGILLGELCENWGVPYQLTKPLVKHWRGRDGKITHDEITQFIPGMPSRTNQEQRDAALLAWACAGLPMRIHC